VFTLDRQNMTVDFFVKWRIVDEVKFYTSTGGSQQGAVERLREIIKNSVVTEFGKRSTREAISVQRMELMRDMLTMARPTAEGLGAELVDFRVKQVEFVAEARESVYRQMRAEREQLAAQTRAEGREAAALITSTADKNRTVILADADRQSQIIRGEGDAKSAEIYANAYNKDPEFFAFYRSINAYKNAIGKKGDVLVLDPNNEFFRYLNQSGGKQ
jgi:membrane protease subunit HflC